jgi:hypothetical protein
MDGASLARPTRRDYPHYVSYKKKLRAARMFDGAFAVLKHRRYTLRSVGPSFFTLFASGEAGRIASRSEGAGTNSRFSESKFFSRGFIQSSAIRPSRITGIRS